MAAVNPTQSTAAAVIPPPPKQCRCCAQIKPETEFYGNGRMGKDTYCKECRKEITRVAVLRREAKKRGEKALPSVPRRLPRNTMLLTDRRPVPEEVKAVMAPRPVKPRKSRAKPRPQVHVPVIEGGPKTQWRPYPSAWAAMVRP